MVKGSVWSWHGLSAGGEPAPGAPPADGVSRIFSSIVPKKRASQGAASGKHGILLCYEIFHFIRAAVQGMCHLRHVTELFLYHADIQRKNFQEMQVLHFCCKKCRNRVQLCFKKACIFGRNQEAGRERLAVGRMVCIYRP